jgi:aminoglycoside phosphotransferase family enzyme
MKRLPDDLRADRVMKHDVGPERLQAAVDRIAQIHESLPVDRKPDGWGAPDRVKKAWADEITYLPTGDDNGLWTDEERVNLDSETAGWLAALEPTLLQRIADGRVRECHGDLRLEHCYLTDPLSIIDPLEFAIEHRFSDVAAEICFLAMELDEIQRPDAGAYVLDRYAALTGDGTLKTVSPFFKRYRAVIRAKVEWIRSGQTEDEQSADHLRRGRGLIELALSYRLSPPRK